MQPNCDVLQIVETNLHVLLFPPRIRRNGVICEAEDNLGNEASSRNMVFDGFSNFQLDVLMPKMKNLFDGYESQLMM